VAAELIITVSGMRGIVGQNLKPLIAEEYGCAFGTFLGQNTASGAKKLSVCVGRDSRPSGPMLASAVADGLCSVGVDVIDLGVVTTPGVGIMTRHLNCGGGVIITASHNPGEYNGVKLLLGNGIAPPMELAEQIKRLFFDKKFNFIDSAGCGQIKQDAETDAVHIEKVLAIADKDAIAAKKFKVVLDSVNGAGGRVGKKLLDKLGCDVVAINDEATGLFAHVPEPTKGNLVGLCDKVGTMGADIGFGLDPDGDRLAIVDQAGRYIGEEYTLGLAARHVFSKRTGRGATNLSTSRMIDDIAAAYGGEVIRTAVGEANVAEAMIKNDCIIGGEGNGGVIDLRVGPVRDSLVGMALVLGLMADTGKSVGALADEIGDYYMDKAKFEANKEEAKLVVDKAKETFADAKVDTTDGARFDFADGWVHIRSSNTEPVMRVIVETKTKHEAEKYINTVARIRKQILD